MAVCQTREIPFYVVVGVRKSHFIGARETLLPINYHKADVGLGSMLNVQRVLCSIFSAREQTDYAGVLRCYPQTSCVVGQQVVYAIVTYKIVRILLMEMVAFPCLCIENMYSVAVDGDGFGGCVHDGNLWRFFVQFAGGLYRNQLQWGCLSFIPESQEFSAIIIGIDMVVTLRHNLPILQLAICRSGKSGIQNVVSDDFIGSEEEYMVAPCGQIDALAGIAIGMGKGGAAYDAA